MPVKKVTKKSVSPVQKKVTKLAAAAVAPEVKGGMSAQVFNLKGVVAKSMTLPKEIFGEKINESLMTQAILIHLGNQRSGTAHSKTRGEVTGSTRKIYKQKGTGRARHGGITAPIFVGGGVAHGPRAHSFTKKLSQKMKQKALFSSLSQKQKEGAIKIVAGLGSVALKTKDMAKSFNKIGLSKESTLLVLSLDKSMENAKKSSRNIPKVSILPASQLNTYEVLKHKNILFAEEAIQLLQTHFMGKGEAK